MADDQQNLSEAEIEAQMLAAMGGDDSVSDAGGRKLPVRHLILVGVSFLVSGVLALILGGHFARPPLNSLRHVPLVGALVPEPEAAEEEEEDAAVDPGTPVGDLHALKAAEVDELITALKKARVDYAARHAELEREAERLRLIEADLQGDRERLERLMQALTDRHAKIEAERKALLSDTLTLQNNERKRLAQLAEIYEQQEPSAAAAELAALHKDDPNGRAPRILMSMQGKKAAAVFDAMPPEVATELKTAILKLRDDELRGPQEPNP